MKKIMSWKPEIKLIAVVAVLVLAVLLVPLLRISVYAAPWYDDYNYAKFVKNFLFEDPTIRGVWNGVSYCVKTQWHAWQGTFSSVFFMALMPGLWGEDMYFLGPLFLIFLLLFAVLVLVKVLVKDVFGGDRASCVVLQAVTAIMVIELIHVAHYGFYWYNAGVHYVGMHSFCLLLVASAIRLVQAKKIAPKILLLLTSILLSVLVGGSNFVTALQGGVLLLTVAAVGCLVYGKEWKKMLWLLPTVLVYVIAFYINVSAPGNQVRAAQYVGWGLNPVQAILQSFVEAAKHLGEFTGWITVAIWILLVPVIWQMVGKTKFTFRMPGVVLLWSACLYATGFTPSLYSLGNAGLARTLNAVKITYQLLLIINEIYWLGWLRGYWEKKKKVVAGGKVCWWFYPIVGVLMLGIFCMDGDKTGTYSSWAAYHYVHTGEAYNFHDGYLDRVERIKSGGSNVVVPPYMFRPWIISVGELAEDPQNEANRAMASWYGKESISCKFE